MSRKVATLCLGTRRDAGTWEEGCRQLGYQVVVSVRSPNPTDEELREFFKCDAEWLYFGGHFNAGALYNHARQERQPGGLALQFTGEDVCVFRDEVFQYRLIKTGGFRLHESAWLILWGGCSTLATASSVRTLRRLFNDHTALGFNGKTSWEVVNSLLGGGSIQPGHFFNRFRAYGYESISMGERAARKSWMEAGQAGYGGKALEDRIRAVDWDGKSWKLFRGQIVPGEIMR